MKHIKAKAKSIKRIKAEDMEILDLEGLIIGNKYTTD